MTLVLASRSPQRLAILRQLGVAFVQRPVDVVEEDTGVPRAVAGENALRKAVAAGALEGEVVLGVDTLVATELEIWGKPANAEAARETLRRLAGRTHTVFSGVALLRADGAVQAATTATEVTFRAVDDEVIDWYVRSGEWEGRAGGYAIQGRGGALVERIAGDYLNVVGLPVATILGLWPGLLDLGS
ncbi:MAG: nucleoside triphosphate pyrophosphatase [Solirubrobacteraceae bacterium]|nr:nucleoside triphosphate pyrophosphatase [Solirubrobacteraceae bacterium]MEA2276384.1 nucleoside triphosphate pyrophosphatase [Solirubrobacteraceae bacterium]MEA2357722.1 nucleoside triphosphate pyrophosphatase [Solirubrobacteraceae bacterium]MEA2393440.1 nucleoside triphosphate pyrophosphatase [Solirubrobacteraceae bacterium]